jgi:hypothetical protein
MKETVTLAKDVDAKKDFSSTRSDKNVHRARNKPERQLGSLGDVIGNIRRDGDTPSIESIATQLSSMHSAQRAPALLALQQTHGNRYVQRVVAGLQAKLVVGQPGDMYEREVDRVVGAVMQMPNLNVQRQANDTKEKLPIQVKTITPIWTLKVQRQKVEGFGYDFGQVRVHHNMTETAHALKARAFTVGAGPCIRLGAIFAKLC